MFDEEGVSEGQNQLGFECPTTVRNADEARTESLRALLERCEDGRAHQSVRRRALRTIDRSGHVETCLSYGRKRLHCLFLRKLSSYF